MQSLVAKGDETINPRMGNTQKLALVISLHCFRDEMEHLYCIVSFDATEDQFF